MGVKLKTYTQPTIPLKEMAIMDTETPDNEVGAEDTSVLKSRLTGRISPYLKIDGFVLDHHSIISMEIDIKGNIPKYSFTIIDKNGVFASNHIPKSDIIANLYIRSSNDTYKPIRNDIYITQITPLGRGTPAEASEGKGNTYLIKGILFIPNISDKSTAKAYPGTSKNALLKISENLKLGFVTNEDVTVDSMNWLKLDSYYQAINDITKSAYKNENSFYDWFIDPYYCLNFINISDMLNSDDNWDYFIPQFVGGIKYLKTSSRGGGAKEPIKNIENSDIPLMLSNLSNLSGLDNFISSYKLVTKQGLTLNEYSYMHGLNFYESTEPYKEPSENFVSYNLSSYEMYKIKNTDIKDVKRYTYGGIEYHNGHEFYVHAQTMNKKNLSELNNINLVVETDEVNFHIVRGMRIPVFIIKEGLETRNEDTDSQLEDNKSKALKKIEDILQINISNVLTGYYFVRGIKYTYGLSNRDGYFFKTEFTLAKTVWEDFFKN